jgi:hypothetical protein
MLHGGSPAQTTLSRASISASSRLTSSEHWPILHGGSPAQTTLTEAEAEEVAAAATPPARAVGAGAANLQKRDGHRPPRHRPLHLRRERGQVCRYHMAALRRTLVEAKSSGFTTATRATLPYGAPKTTRPAGRAACTCRRRANRSRGINARSRHRP